MEKSKHTVRRKHAEVEYHIVQHKSVRRVSSQIHSTDIGTAEFCICCVLLGCHLPNQPRSGLASSQPPRHCAAVSKVNVSSETSQQKGRNWCIRQYAQIQSISARTMLIAGPVMSQCILLVCARGNCVLLYMHGRPCRCSQLHCIIRRA